MTGISAERAHHTRLDELRRQAYLVAQVRQVRPRPLGRLAAVLRDLAARLEASRDAGSGPWREDFAPAARTGSAS